MASDERAMLPVGPVQPACLHQLECVSSPLEVDGEVSGQDGLLYHKNNRLELLLNVLELAHVTWQAILPWTRLTGSGCRCC